MSPTESSTPAARESAQGLPRRAAAKSAPAGSIAERVAVRRGWESQARVLSLFVAVALAVDWLFPLRGLLSLGLCGFVTVLSVPWAYVIVRGDPTPPSAVAHERRVRATRPGWLWHSLLLLALASFLIAKWLVLYYSQATDPLYAGSSRSYALAVGLVTGAGLLGRGLRMARFVTAASEHPARLMALSFGATGLAGALLLSLPASLENVRSVSLIDSLFMAFSAVCVTGLAVSNVAETYSLFGQAVLCALIQVGGLGIMVLSAAVVILAGQRMRVKSSAVLAEMVDVSSIASLRRTVITICAYAFVIEAAGALLLHSQFRSYEPVAQRFGHEMSGAGDAWWAAVFHSVSAFCNAGFSNVEAGLVPFRGNPVIVLGVTTLIVLGGLGFPVLDELTRAALTRIVRRRAPALSLHSRIVLITSGILLLVVALGYLALEWTHSLKGQTVLERVTAAVLQSASSRTAGFNVIDTSALVPGTIVLTCAAMFIGASPGSTGGGIKTTTFAALYAGLRAELFGKNPRLLNRTLPDGVIRRAIAVTFLSGVIVFAFFFCLLLVEPHPPLELLFETMSAFSTTGLSTGITPQLSVTGKALIILAMFVGRIGPLTLALAVSGKDPGGRVELPKERVMIG